jgi:hypothetical protein
VQREGLRLAAFFAASTLVAADGRGLLARCIHSVDASLVSLGLPLIEEFGYTETGTPPGCLSEAYARPVLARPVLCADVDKHSAATYIE